MDPLARAAVSRARSALSLALGETATRPDIEFVQMAAALAFAKGDPASAAELVPRYPRVATILRQAAVGAGSLNSPDWASQLPGYGEVSAGFAESLRATSAFDRMLPSMRRVPLRTRVSAVTNAAVGHVSGAGIAKPVTRIEFENSLLEPTKAIALTVFTEELLRLADPAAVEMLGRELRGAVSAATNAEFVAQLMDGAPTVASSGSTAEYVLADLAALLAQLSLGSSSSLFLLLAPARLARLAVKKDDDGKLAFPGLTPTGGTIAGIELLPVDLMPTAIVGSPQTAHDQCVLVDADGVAAASDIVTLDVTRHASIEMATDPSHRTTVTGSPLAPVESTVINLWQTNSRALRAERWFAAKPFRSGAVATLQGVQW